MEKRNQSLKTNSDNEQFLKTILTHISINDEIEKTNTILHEKDKDHFKKIISMSHKHHKLTKHHDNFKLLFPNTKLKKIPSKVKFTQYQIYENARKFFINRNEHNNLRIFTLPSKINRKIKINKLKNNLLSMSDPLDVNNVNSTSNLIKIMDNSKNEKIKNIKYKSYKKMELPKLYNREKSFEYENFKSNILKLENLTKSLQLEYTRLHFRK